MSANKTCHFKLVLLGDTAVGKSCLVVRFVRDEFFEFQEPTIGGASARGPRAAHANVLRQSEHNNILAQPSSLPDPDREP